MSTSDGILRGMPKDLAKEARRLRKAGWTIATTGGNHLRWVSPQGVVVTSGLTPSSGGLQHTLRDLRKAEKQSLAIAKGKE